MRKIAAFLLSFVIFTAILIVFNRTSVPLNKVPTPPSIQPSITINEALTSVNTEELRKTLYWLTSPELEGRMSGKRGNDIVKDFLVKYYQDLGFDVRTQEFTIQNLNNYKEQGSGRTANVIASLPGNDPGLMNETVVVGGHFDHIGFGPSMSRAPQRREIHPGADDNASGTVAVMGVAKVFARMKGKNKRRIVLIAFSAEEMGLIGSKYYVNNPTYPNTVFMLNMDMIGRLKGRGTLDALGAGNSPEVKRVLSGLQGYPFKPNITSGSGGGSDHAPFYQKGIPICFLHTGTHVDYHTPGDTADKIDYEGLTWITKYAAHIGWEISNLPTKVTFIGEVGKETEFFDHDLHK